MKILIATGIFVPEVGGPATYALRIADEFITLGHEVIVLTYSDVKHHPKDKEKNYKVVRVKRSNKLLNYWRYYRKALHLLKGCDLVYTLDHSSAGIPASWAADKIRKPLYVRVGGDSLWERYIQTHSDLTTLEDFYKNGLQKRDDLRYKLMMDVFEDSKKVIFTTEWQKNIFEQYYLIPKEKNIVVANATPKLDKKDHSPANKEIVFAGRFTQKNNLFTLIEAFKKIKDKNLKLVLIGEGPMWAKIRDAASKHENISIEEPLSRKDLLDRISKSYLMVFPSLSDISPNTLLESLALATPFISTNQIGFDWVKEKTKTFDPRKAEQITSLIDELSDKFSYEEYKNQLKAINYSFSYREAAEQTIEVFQND